jgi:hypothetical protein
VLAACHHGASAGSLGEVTADAGHEAGCASAAQELRREPERSPLEVRGSEVGGGKYL